MSPRKFSSKKDIVIVLFVILFAVIGWLFYQKSQQNISSDHLVAEIYEDQELLYTLPLNKAMIVFIPNQPEVQIEVKNGAVGFIHSNCPDQVCVHTGFLRNSGQTAACLPNKIIVKVVSTKEDDSAVDMAVS